MKPSKDPIAEYEAENPCECTLYAGLSPITCYGPTDAIARARAEHAVAEAMRVKKPKRLTKWRGSELLINGPTDTAL